MKKDIREINVFRVWVNALVEGIVQEYPTDICFCSYADAEKRCDIFKLNKNR